MCGLLRRLETSSKQERTGVHVGRSPRLSKAGADGGCEHHGRDAGDGRPGGLRTHAYCPRSDSTRMVYVCWFQCLWNRQMKRRLAFYLLRIQCTYMNS